MTLIIVRNKKVLTIAHLWRSVLKYIFDEKNMSSADIREMQESIVNWKSAIDIENEKMHQAQLADIRRFGKPLVDSHQYSEQEFQLQAMGKMLVENEQGLMDKRKEFMKRHGVDYRKYYRLPEAYKPEDFIRAQKDLEQTMKDNPEDYK